MISTAVAAKVLMLITFRSGYKGGITSEIVEENQCLYVKQVIRNYEEYPDHEVRCIRMQPKELKK